MLGLCVGMCGVCACVCWDGVCMYVSRSVQALAVGVTDLAGAVGVEAKAPRAEGQGGRRLSRPQ